MKQSRIATACAVAAAFLLAIVFASRNDETRAQTQQNAVSTDVETLRESIGNFFENMSDVNKGPNKAVEEFLKNSSLADNEKTRSRVAEGLKTINQNFGAYVAYEPIGVKTVGTDLLVFRYLYKCQDYPVVWYFTYYRPRAKSAEATLGAPAWTLIGFRYDTNLDAALLDATFVGTTN